MVENFVFQVVFYKTRHGNNGLADQEQEKATQQGHDENENPEYKYEIQEHATCFLPEVSLIKKLIETKTFHNIINGYPYQLGGDDHEDV